MCAVIEAVIANAVKALSIRCYSSVQEMCQGAQIVFRLS